MVQGLTETADRFRSDLLIWSEDNLRDYPWRENKRSLYEVFVAELFLTQTPSDNVARVYPDFLERFPTLGVVHEASVDDLREAIEPLGFQCLRAEALSKISAEYADLPEDPEKMIELTRVGPYVTNATLCIAFERALPILDRNVERVYRRVFGDSFPEIESNQIEFVSKMLPQDGTVARTYNLALVDFGALVCTKRGPQCERCFARDYCTYYGQEVDS